MFKIHLAFIDPKKDEIRNCERMTVLLAELTLVSVAAIDHFPSLAVNCVQRSIGKCGLSTDQRRMSYGLPL